MIRKFILAALLLCAPSVYAQGTISAMTAASALSGTELFECVQSGSKKCTAAQIKTFTSASPTLVTPNIGTPSAGVLTNATGYTIGALSGAGTGVLTALGVNIGSAGAPVLLNGALGTPSSGTATNLTGTASGLTAGTVTTNANLTGDVTSSGNATTLATVNSNVGSFTNSSITVNGKGLITAASSGAAGAVLTANSFTDTQTITKSIAATSTDGAVLQNTTAAAAGAQQWSPRLRLTGQGWKTTATAASQSVDWVVENVPVQGTTAPTSKLVFSSSINGGAYAELASISSGSQMKVGVTTEGSILFGTSGQLAGAGSSLRILSTAGAWTATLTSLHYATLSTGLVKWSSGANPETGIDSAIGRNAAGVLEVNNGTLGQYRDILTRNTSANHFIGVGTAPTVAGSCGTSPTIAGTDSAHKVTTGSGSPTSCTVTFGTAYTTAPVCTANAQTTTTALNMATTTTTAIVSAAALTAGEVLHVVCLGF